MNIKQFNRFADQARLKERMRNTAKLKLVDGKSINEIARQLEVSPQAICKASNRMLEEFKQ